MELKRACLLLAAAILCIRAGGVRAMEDADKPADKPADPLVVAEWAGDWSKPVSDNNGRTLRGRLLVVEKPPRENSRELVVYLELQDVSEAKGRSLHVYCDLGRHDAGKKDGAGLACELVDAKGTAKKTSPSAFGGGAPGPEWLVIPSDGMIRFRTSPYGPRAANARVICPYLLERWEIADSDPSDYFLKGTLTVAPAEKDQPAGAQHVWRGTLDLPPVKLASEKK